MAGQRAGGQQYQKQRRRQAQRKKGADGRAAVQLDMAPLAVAIEEDEIHAVEDERRQPEQHGKRHRQARAAETRLLQQPRQRCRKRDQQQGDGAAPPHRMAAGPFLVGREHEHRQQPVADADGREAQPAAEAHGHVHRQRLGAEVELRERRQPARKQEGEQRAQHGGEQNACEPHRREAGRQRHPGGPHAQQRGKQHEGGEQKTGRQQDAGNRQKRQPAFEGAGQFQEAGQQKAQPRKQAKEGWQHQPLGAQRLGHQHRHELEQRAAQEQAEPADRHHMHHDQRFGRLGRHRRITVAGNHQPLRPEQEDERGGEMGHSPARERGADHGCDPSAAVAPHVRRGAEGCGTFLEAPIELPSMPCPETGRPWRRK